MATSVKTIPPHHILFNFTTDRRSNYNVVGSNEDVLSVFCAPLYNICFPKLQQFALPFNARRLGCQVVFALLLGTVMAVGRDHLVTRCLAPTGGGIA